MTYLLDVNVLIALCDEKHAHHRTALRFFGSGPRFSWATCPLTENAFLRITGNPSYPRGTGIVAEQMQTLRELRALHHHEFWPDSMTLLSAEIWSNVDRLNTSDLTDLYLLALAAKRNGKLATLDRSIPAHRIVRGPESLHTLGAAT